MPASDSMPVPRRNTAFRLYFELRNSSGTLVTTWAGADSEESLDGGAFTDCTNEATEIGTSGIGFLDLTAAEMNADCTIIKITFTNTGAVTPVFYLYPQELGDIRVNATYWFDAALTATYVAPDNAGVTTLTTRLTNTRAGNLDFLTAAPPVLADIVAGVWSHGTRSLTTFGSLVADIWSNVTRTITGGTLTVSPPTVGAIADAVWDEETSGHVTAGTTGAALAAAGASGDPLASIVPGGYGVGTAGYQLARIGSAGATVISPVAASGAVTLYQNATYSTARGTALVWSLTSALVLTGGSVTLDVAGSSYAGAITGSAGAWVVTVQLTAAQTAAMALGVKRYDLSATVSGDALPPLAAGSLTVLKNV